MKTNAERFAELVPLFKAAIVDVLKEGESKDSAGNVLYTKSTSALRAAAFKAFKELTESEADPIGPMLAVNVWNAVMLCNESAFHQGLERSIKAGEITGLKVVGGTTMIAKGYVE